jgi:DNA-directed RNA polymerase specialized sigma24 family protein
MQNASSVIFYSRSEHGQIPVRVLGSPGNTSETRSTPIYELLLPEGAIRYDSARQLLITLTGHPEARHWTFDRYFRVGKYDKNNNLTILDPFTPRFLDERLSYTTVTNYFDHGDKVSTEVCHGDKLIIPPCQTLTTGTNALGIDLAKRGHEVAKLLFAGFGQYIYGKGYDPDDVLQEVYRGILVRNQGTCPWDAAKSSFGHYVHMVCSCVLSNYHRRQGRKRGKELDWASAPAEQADGKPALPGRDPEQELATYLQRHVHHDPDAQLALRILPLVTQGYDRGEIAAQLGVSRAVVSRALTFLRQATQLWTQKR